MTSEQPIPRPLEPADAVAVLESFTSAPDEMARQGQVTDLASAEKYVRTLIDDANQWPFAVAVQDKLAGLVCITVDRTNLNGWFWYWMIPTHRGCGWTSAAARAVADWALTAGGLQRLELGHRVNNPASGAVARAAGFVHEGIERGKFLIDGQRLDVHTYGRLTTDPWPQPSELAALFGDQLRQIPAVRSTHR
jgi:RimJ/RimL family protein N-acetyltransferase